MFILFLQFPYSDNTWSFLVWLVTGTPSGFGETFVESILTKYDKFVATAHKDVSRLEGLKAKVL